MRRVLIIAAALVLLGAGAARAADEHGQAAHDEPGLIDAINLEQWKAPFEFTWPFDRRQSWLDETFGAILAGITCGLLGCYVVLRRMALIGDALSHSVLPGVVIAFMVAGTSILVLFVGALAAGLLTAGLINVIARHSRSKEDSAIGIAFTALFAVGIILISALPRGTHFDLKCFLFGDVLAIGSDELTMLGIMTAAVLAAVTLLYRPLKLVSFDATMARSVGVPTEAMHYLLMGLLAGTVVASITAVGVVMVVAMVITPASAAYQLTNRLTPMMFLSAIFGGVSAAAGMSVAFIFNSPPGPAMVVVAACIFGVVMMLSPEYGVVAKLLRRRRSTRHIDGENILKATYALRERGEQPAVDAVAQVASLPAGRVRSVLGDLRREGLVERNGERVSLTDPGWHRAAEMVRSHRLWESYLVERTGLPPEKVHDRAEQLEHAHELADQVADELGHPDTDPHGTPIPNPLQREQE